MAIIVELGFKPETWWCFTRGDGDWNYLNWDLPQDLVRWAPVRNREGGDIFSTWLFLTIPTIVTGVFNQPLKRSNRRSSPKLGRNWVLAFLQGWRWMTCLRSAKGWLHGFLQIIAFNPCESSESSECLSFSGWASVRADRRKRRRRGECRCDLVKKSACEQTVLWRTTHCTNLNFRYYTIHLELPSIKNTYVSKNWSSRTDWYDAIFFWGDDCWIWLISMDSFVDIDWIWFSMPKKPTWFAASVEATEGEGGDSGGGQSGRQSGDRRGGGCAQPRGSISLV